jgi:hypothetical protein
VHRASWQAITWVLVAAIVVYVLIGPNVISWGLAIFGVLSAVTKAAEARWVAWQLARGRHASRGP